MKTKNLRRKGRKKDGKSKIYRKQHIDFDMALVLINHSSFVE